MSLVEKYLIGSVHHELSCSKFPAWKQCPRYDGGDVDSTDLQHPANRGTLQHEYLVQCHSGKVADKELETELTSDEIDGIKWAKGWIKDTCNAPVFEVKVSYMDDDFNEVYSGALDWWWVDDDGLLHIADLKTGDQRNYFEQLCGYALAKMQQLGTDHCECHIVYSKSRHVEEFDVTFAEAKEIVETIIARRKNDAILPSKCDYCQWCANIESCSAVVTDVVKVAEGYSDGELDLSSWHPSDIERPDEMAVALKVAKVLSAWCESVKHHANDMTIKQGLPIPGTKVKTRSGKQSLTDVNEAFSLSGFTPEEFLGACTVSVPKLADIEKERSGESKAKARKAIEARLDSVIKQGNSSSYVELVKEK